MHAINRVATVRGYLTTHSTACTYVWTAAADTAIYTSTYTHTVQSAEQCVFPHRGVNAAGYESAIISGACIYVPSPAD